jgi:hypothetical protein
MTSLSLLGVRGVLTATAFAIVVPISAAQPRVPTPATAEDWANPTGAHKVVMEEEAAIQKHTVYRPEDLKTGERNRLPIVVFMGPGRDFNGTAFGPFFTEVASHGFLVVAAGPPEPRGGSGRGFPRVTPSDLSAALDWAVGEHARKDSKYFGKIDTAKVAVMGQSGGAGSYR